MSPEQAKIFPPLPQPIDYSENGIFKQRVEIDHDKLWYQAVGSVSQPFTGLRLIEYHEDPQNKTKMEPQEPVVEISHLFSSMKTDQEKKAYLETMLGYLACLAQYKPVVNPDSLSNDVSFLEHYSLETFVQRYPKVYERYLRFHPLRGKALDDIFELAQAIHIEAANEASGWQKD